MTTRYRWVTVALEADGKQVRAFDVKGKPIAPDQLPKLLPKLAPVALFKGADPDPYYLRVLRPDTVVIKAPADKFTPPPRRD
jgi:hypothetical protein